jgi:hypothetical protein
MTCSPRAHFRAFGFVVLRGALSDDEATALTTEADRAIRDATGNRYLVDGGQGGISPATTFRRPVIARR